MARQTTSLEVNTFVQGLITEASPLTFPENASIDEDNFVLLRDGSRRRRLGMDFEDDHQIVVTGVPTPPTGELAFSTFNWENAGGDPSKELLVVQTGRGVRVFDLDVTPLSSGEIFQTGINEADASQIFSFTVIDGSLVIATGEIDIILLDYDGSTVTRSGSRLKIRDLFGVQAIVGGRDLTLGENVNFRPSTINNNHTYNLRNQSWAMPREMGDINDRDRYDPLQRLFAVAGVYPSNADSVTQALYPDPSDEDNRTGDQFYAKDLENNPVGTFPAAKGHFIIDALVRGQSRLNQVQQLQEDFPELTRLVSSLPTDTTPGGASTVAEFAGRVFYAGFSGEITGGDSASPRMSSYVLFSQLIQDPQDIAKCYQEGDPTSIDAPDLLDTDGGFLRIEGAYRIQKLVNVGTSLMVVAQNGVWMITGGSDFGFTANNHLVNKISERGADSPGSVVGVDNTVIFWADDAIYHVKQNEFGDWGSENITQNTIQKFYEDISPVDKLLAQGKYDSYDNKVRWVYRNRISETEPVKELILDLSLGAFYTSTIKTDIALPRVAAPLLIPPFRLTDFDEAVTVDGELVTIDGETVTVPKTVRGQGFREIAYLTITSTDPIEFTFSLYKDAGFRDFRTLDGTGVDADAFMVTGWNGGGDFLRYKQVPYIQFHFNRTEDGFTDDGTGNLFPVNESSCLVQAQWEWANSANSNRWGREFEAYRYRRLYSPSGPADPFDNGFQVITTKNKLRGKGRVLSLFIKTAPDKDCQILGWSMLTGVTGGV